MIATEEDEGGRTWAYDPRRGVHALWPAEISFERGGVWPWTAPLAVCAICRIATEVAFGADTGTHHIVNRSGDPTEANLCCHCWSFYLREECA